MNLHNGRYAPIGVAGLSLVLTMVACSSTSTGTGTGGSPGNGSGGGSTNGSGGSSSSGGASSGGSSASGGASSGGSSASGGASSGGSSASGGAASGGASASGGAATGGASTGGNGGGQEGGRPGGGGRTASGGAGGSAGGGGATGSAFALTSPAHMDNAKFDAKFTCAQSPPRAGQMVGKLNNGINPELDWAGAPPGTMSFAITFLDATLIDANMPSFGNHWAIWNIPPSVMQLPEGTTMLSGALMMAKQTGVFLAPCAQSLMNNMDDRYEFTIYALPTATLTVSGTGVMNVRDALKAASPLGTAVLRGHAGQFGK